MGLGRVISIVSALYLGAACSLVVDAQLDGHQLRCATVNDGGLCAAGYSCLGTQCVEDGSLGPTETCLEQRQCRSDLECLDFVCGERCLAIYDAASGCESDSLCIPIYEDEKAAYGRCTRSVCSKDADCRNPATEACFVVGGGGECLTECTLAPDTVDGLDQCTPGNAGDRACVPAVAGSAVFTCRLTGVALEGRDCHPFQNPCAAIDDGALACHPTSGGNHLCRRVCKDGAACGSGLDCVSVTGGAYSLCLPVSR